MSETNDDDVIITLARETLAGDVRDAFLAYQKHDKNPMPWTMRGESAQREVIQQAAQFANDLIERVARIVVAGGRETVDVQLEQVVIKDGLKGVIKCPASPRNRILLGDAQGQIVTLAFVSTAAYDGERKPAVPQKDQPTFLDDEDAA